MVKIGLEHSVWSSLVNKAENSTELISGGKKIDLKKNTLTPFKDLFVIQETAIEEVNTYKLTSHIFSEKMKAVADKIVNEDNEAGKSFNNNTNIGKTRFN